MWESTYLMARAVGEGLGEGGAKVKLLPARGTHRSDIATEIFNAGALVVGSPTLNNNLFPSVADVLYYIKGLRPRNLVGAAFGSYGWSSEAVKQIQALLKEMKVDVVGDGLSVKYVPDAEVLDQCCALGRQVAEKLLARCGELEKPY
jgi:flavorubredoxin